MLKKWELQILFLSRKELAPDTGLQLSADTNQHLLSVMGRNQPFERGLKDDSS